MPVIEFGAPGTPAWSGHRRLLSKVTAANWGELKTLCEAGGNEVTLSNSFDASSYPGQIIFSGKTCVVKGQGKTLDAKEGGRFFYGSGAGSSLEVHGLVLKNGHVGYVSSLCALPRFFERTICQKNYLKLLLQFLGRDMGRSLNNHRSVNSVRIAMKLGAVGRGESQHSFLSHYFSALSSILWKKN
jgi:hypothetical protein